MARTQVQAELIATNAISGTIIADNAITATHIATNSISGTLVQDGGIVTTMIANNNVTATKIVTDAIQTRHIADDQVTAAKLANSINTDIATGAAALPTAGGTMTGDLILNDNVKLEIGSASGGDLQIYHDASDSYITDTGTGNLLIQYSDLYFSKDAGSTHSVVFRSTGRVGIGTTGPDRDLVLQTEGSTNGFRIKSNDENLLFLGAAASSGGGVDTAYMSLTNGGSDKIIFNTGGTTVAQIIGDTNSETFEHLNLKSTVDGNPSRVNMFFESGQGKLAKIEAEQRAGGSDAYGHLAFWTANAGTMTQAMTVNYDGRIGQGTESPGFNYDMIYSHATLGAMRLQNQGSFGTYNTLLQVDTFNSASANFQYLVCHSGNGSAVNDIEFNLRGDANAYADGSWSGGGADYAEYFEWQDGNSSNEDRIGHSVSLVGNKIKIAESGETVIGVISGNPAVVGDTGWNKWHDKYQKDDYGRYLRDESGHKLLNTDYDDTKEYVTREARKEWDIVGLMGKLRIKKGQQTGTNWIKMRDISASVEEWLVI